MIVIRYFASFNIPSKYIVQYVEFLVHVQDMLQQGLHSLSLHIKFHNHLPMATSTLKHALGILN